MIIEEENRSLLTVPIEEEVRNAVFAIGADKAPGSDGLNGKFYQTYWHLLAGEVVSMVRTFFRSGPFEPNMNETSLILIAKREGAQKSTDFRPISLCNVTYKIISNRLRPLLHKCISQS